MRKDYYDEIYDKFKLYNPAIERTVCEWRPSNKHSIRLVLNDGTEWEYHHVLNSLRRVVKYDYTEDQCKEEFRNRLLELMADNYYNQQTLAEAAGISQASISKYLNKKSLPDLYTVRQLARALNCSVNDLLDP
jgi:DNA-binding Xre family transcriptional regulator